MYRCNMGYTERDIYKVVMRLPLDSSGVCLIYMVAYGIPDQHQQTASHAERSSNMLEKAFIAPLY